MHDLEEYATNSKYIKHLYKCFYDLHNILIDFNVSYWATGGTLLGAVRHRGIIPIDDDVDLGISHRDVPIIISSSFKKALDKKGYYVKLHSESKKKANNGMIYDWIKINSRKKVDGRISSIDLFTYYLDSDSKNKLRCVPETDFVKKIWPNEMFYISEFLPLVQAPFGKGVIFIPKNSEKYLSRSYGRSWRTKMKVTMDQDHMMLDKPIIIRASRFYPAEELADATKQYRLKKDDILLTMKGNNLFHFV